MYTALPDLPKAAATHRGLHRPSAERNRCRCRKCRDNQAGDQARREPSGQFQRHGLPRPARTTTSMFSAGFMSSSSSGIGVESSGWTLDWHANLDNTTVCSTRTASCPMSRSESVRLRSEAWTDDPGSVD